ncbi:MAG: hypothetical protein AB8G77_10720 [Rhodothermales bacterium]
MQGCTIFDAGDAETLVKVEPVADSYVFTDTTTVSFNITNRSTESIYYGGCDQQHIEVLLDRTIVDDFKTFSLCDCVCIETIEPGETVQFSYWLADLKQADHEVETPRFYRIWPTFYNSNSLAGPIPRDLIDARQFLLDQ